MFKNIATPLPLPLNFLMIKEYWILILRASIVFYESLILTHTRPNLCYIVQNLSQFMQSPSEPHLQALYHTLNYLHFIAGHSILLQDTSQLTLQATSDSRWASCPDTRRPVTGYLVLLGNSPIRWKSKIQSTVSRSSSEVEYHAMAVVASEVMAYSHSHWVGI